MFRGRRWKIKDQSEIPEPDLGECNYETSTIFIPINGETIDELDVIIHEALHSCIKDLDEDAVDQSATDIARLLFRLGWRKDYDV